MNFVLALDEEASVAFTAFSDPTLAIYQPSQLAQFAYAPTNLGSHFDTSTSVFTCPVSGVYEFRLHLHSTEAYAALLLVYLNDDVIASALAQDSTFAASASTSAITHCEALSRVKVMAGNIASYVLGPTTTLFSGKLLTTNSGKINKNIFHCFRVYI